MSVKYKPKFKNTNIFLLLIAFKSTQKLEAFQRKCAIMVSRAYRTISYDARLVATNLPFIDLKIF